MTTNTNTFETKEDYLAFRKAWSNAVNSDEHYITSGHHVLYNILRGRDYYHGFTMVSNRNKLMNGMSPNIGLMMAVSEVRGHIKYGSERFFKPFGDTVTAEMLAKIELPKVEQLYRDFGVGRKIIPALASGELIAKTQGDLDQLIKSAEEAA